MKYDLLGTKTIEVSDAIEADSPHAAALAYFEKHDFYPEVVAFSDGQEDGETVYEVATACECCGLGILNDEPYHSGEDCDICAKCAQEIAEAEQP